MEDAVDVNALILKTNNLKVCTTLSLIIYLRVINIYHWAKNPEKNQIDLASSHALRTYDTRYLSTVFAHIACNIFGHSRVQSNLP